MMDRPIIFDAESVRAIISGNKWQTRRVVFGEGARRPGYARDTWNTDGYDVIVANNMITRVPWTALAIRDQMSRPYGAAGDRLWVRESLRLGADNVWRYAADDSQVMVLPDYAAIVAAWAHHRAGSVCAPRYMPRWAARLVLTITDVRVERLQAITTKDIESEGLRRGMADQARPYDESMRAWWIERWDAINGKRAPWASNPWVWVVSFEVTR